jgi:hypothetical protein
MRLALVLAVVSGLAACGGDSSRIDAVCEGLTLCADGTPPERALVCADLQADANNCGSCNFRCPASAAHPMNVCVAGKCMW